MSRSIRFEWERQVVSNRGPVNPTTRHVLLALGTFTNKEGIAWPTTLQLAAATGLSERTVCTHLKIAANEAWIEIKERKVGKNWKHHIYKITIPTLRAEPRSAANGSLCAGTDADVIETDALGTETGDGLPLKDVQSNNVMNTSNNISNNNNSVHFKEGKPEQSITVEQTAQGLGIARHTDEPEGAFQLRVMKAMITRTASKMATT